MDYNEVWGIAFSRVSGFFGEQDDVIRLDERSFIYIDSRIELEALPDKRMGSLSMARTRVRISGGDAADAIHRRLYMRFLSAGG